MDTEAPKFEHLETFYDVNGFNNIAFLPKGAVLVSTSSDGVILWDLSGFEGDACAPIHEIEEDGHSHSGYRALSVLPDLVAAAVGCTVELRKSETGEIVETLPYPDMINALAFPPNGNLLAVALNDTIRILDRASRQEQTLTGHSALISGLAFSHDGKQLASSSEDCTVKTWEVSSGAELKMFKGHTELVTDIIFSRDGKELASASFDGTIRVWNLGSGQTEWILNADGDIIRAVAFSPGAANLLASSSNSGFVRLWDICSGAITQTLEAGCDPIYDIAFSPDGDTSGRQG